MVLQNVGAFEEEKGKQMSDVNTDPTLREQIERFKQAGAAKANPEVRALRQRETEKLIQAGIAEQSVHVGDTAPDFTLPDAEGKEVTLSALLKAGRVVLTFYRGEWCPYCNLQLRAYQTVLPQIEALGAVLVAVSPQLPDFSRAMITKADLTFPVLSDVGNQVARQYRLVFTVPESLRPYTANASLPQFNGNESWELPMPGTFVIQENGVIQLAFVHADYTRRLEPAEILSALHSLRER